MDDNAVYNRPFYYRAPSLLGGSNTSTQGTVLVTKTIFLKIGIDVHDFEEQEGLYLSGWQRVTENELRSPEFKEQRRLWMERGASSAGTFIVRSIEGFLGH